MPKLRLDQEARERYGCAEELDYDPSSMSIDEAIEIQERTGINYVDWSKLLRANDPRALKGVVWMALNRAGHQIGWDDVRFDVKRLEVVREPAGRGKELTSTPPSPSEPDATP